MRERRPELGPMEEDSMTKAPQMRHRPRLERKVYERTRKRTLNRLGKLHPDDYNRIFEEELATEPVPAGAAR